MNIKRKLSDIDYLPKGLREYTENDLADMLEIFNETALTGANSPVTGPVSIEELGFCLDYYKKDGLPVYVLERAKKLVGWLSINRFSWGTKACGNTGEVSIYVRKAFYGRGVGCRLGQACIPLARASGIETLVGWVMADNVDSQLITQAMGGELWCRLPKIARFGDKRADVLLYGRDIAHIPSAKDEKVSLKSEHAFVADYLPLESQNG